MVKKKSKALVKAEPRRAPAPFEKTERWFENFFRRPFPLMGARWWPGLRMPEFEEVAPSVDIFEDGDNVIVKAELPGMSKEDIHVTLTEDTLPVSGEKKKEERVEKKDYHRLERSYGSFRRSFTLPGEVQTEKAAARFKDGILEIRVQKSAEAKKKEKRIMIE
jgi:HSP20 family protein